MDKINLEKQKEYIEKALKVIKDEKIFYIDEIASSIGMSRSNFYFYGLDKMDIIIEAIEQTKISIKKKLRAKWEDSESATLQIALYKVIANDDETQRLNSDRGNNQNNAPTPPPQVTIVFNNDDVSVSTDIKD